MQHVETAPAIRGWDGADRSLGEIRKLEAKVQEMDAAKLAEVQRVQEKHTAKIQPMLERIGLLAKGLQDFAEFHREDLGAQKSKKLNHGLVGFRLGHPSLKTLPKWTWKKVLACVKGSRWADRFVRVKEEVAKDLLLGSNLDPEEMKALGVRMVQEERFFYEAKTDETVATPTA